MKNSAQLTEQEIIARIIQGEKPLYELIVRRFNPYLYKIGRSYNYNHQDTEDLMQDTYVDAFKNLAQFKEQANFKTWLVRIMLNNCYRKQQKSSFKKETPEDHIHENLQPMFSQGKNDMNQQIHNKELGQIIEKALEQINQEYRIIFSLRVISGFNTLETAEILNISQANVKVRLNRCKVLLRKEIQKYYSFSELYEFHLVYCDKMVHDVMQKINY